MIDIGNSVAKVAAVDKGHIIYSFKTENLTPDVLEEVLASRKGMDRAIVCSVRGYEDGCAAEVAAFLKGRLDNVIELDQSVEVPLENRYATPQTLGCDRMAAAVGAATMFPGCNALVVDFGTAITIDMVTARGEYLGGNISPGATTRFKSLNAFTGTLPLRDLTGDVSLLGDSTAGAIESGVVNGILYEIEGYIRDVTARFGSLQVIFTGGDGNFFAKRLKNPIFVTCDLVIYGLDRILEYNTTAK